MISDQADPDYPIPEDEERRLEKLYDLLILDTSSEESFTQLAELARYYFDVPIAGISLVELDRVWFKACRGMNLREMDRRHGFATYAILSDEVLQVPDTKQDERFSDNPYVEDEPNIRAYHGAPLITEEGYCIGCFCIIDHEPRELSEEELGCLRTLRDQAMRLLGNRFKRKQLRRITRRDSTTGLLNRTYLLEELDRRLEQIEGTDRELAFLVVNVENVRRMNDVLGQEAGDQILRVVADRLRREERNLECGRLVGTKFGVILEYHEDERREIQQVVRNIQDRLTRTMELQDIRFQVICRVGYAIHPFHSQDRDQLISLAESALRNTSVEEGGRIQMYNPEFGFTGAKELNLQNKFRKSLDEGNLRLFYQPIICFDRGKVVGMEALIRWHLPEEGYIPPPSIINIAQSQGMMSKLGRWILRTACRDTVNWNRELASDLSVSVNVSAVEFLQQEEYVQAVHTIVEETGIKPERLQLEITETEVMKDVDYTKRNLNALKEQDVKLALDDFGTGYSSLKYLSEFPVDRLKIDNLFTGKISKENTSDRMITSIIQLGKSMDLETIAEGVETNEQYEVLQRNECDMYQGYFCSEALPPEEFIEFVKQRNT